MVSFQEGVVTKICNEANPFLLSCHCTAHCTNLAVLDVTKTPASKGLSSKVDSLLNSISSFLNKSNKHEHALTILQEQFFNSKKTINNTIKFIGL